jgi:hypothetical protein
MQYHKRFITTGFWYGFEKDFHLVIKDHGVVQLGKRVYFSKRTDVISSGGDIRIGDNFFLITIA